MNTRRDLLRGATVAVTAASYSRIQGANDRMNLGVIGPGDRGRFDMSQFQKNSSVDVVALCDVYAEHLDLAHQTAPKAKDFKDHRALLDMKEVDMVLVATRITGTRASRSMP